MAALSMRRIVDASSAVAIQAASLFTGVPTVLTVHGTTLFSPSKSLAERFKKYLERLIFLRCRYDVLLSVTQNLQEVKGSGTPVILLRNGVDPERFRPDPQAASQAHRAASSPLRLLFVGRLEHIKGLPILLEAMEALGDIVELSVVGEGSLKHSLEQTARTKSLPVRFWGTVQGAALVKLYQEHDVFVLPSLSEGFPLTLLEAAAAGLAVVASHVGDVPALVHEGKNGLLVPAGDAKELTKALLHLVNHRGLVQEFGDYGQKILAPLFTWKQTARTIENAYEQAL
jgi:glycosyltransferase involved in cell wall biosynthesis